MGSLTGYDPHESDYLGIYALYSCMAYASSSSTIPPDFVWPIFKFVWEIACPILSPSNNQNLSEGVDGPLAA